MTNPDVDNYIANATQWQPEMVKLRELLLSCGLTEVYKWRIPFYMFNDTNLFAIQAFKNYIGIGFFNGALINDTEDILVKPGENTQGARQIRFTDLSQIVAKQDIIRAYIFEAMEIEKAGIKPTPIKTDEIVWAEELIEVMNQDAKFKTAFEALTPGRKRAYNMHFSSSKQSTTRLARIKKYMPRILNGKGIHDCVCGFSQKMPSCDGSHKKHGVSNEIC